MTRGAPGTASSPAPRERGIALFIVMVVVLVVGVITAQLVITTKVEERIAKSRTGELEMVLAQESAARAAMMRILEDWENDQSDEEGDTDTTGDGASGPGAGSDPPVGDTPPPVAGGGSYDSRHETWARSYQETLNEVTVKVRITDAESRLDINKLWNVAMLPREDESSDGESDEDDDDDPTSADEEEGLDRLADMVDGGEEEEWTPPSPEKEQRARELIGRLIESIIAYNHENDFDYDETPDPDAAANEIIDYVLDRYRRPETRPIRSLDGLRDLEEVTAELFYGPRIEEEDLDEDDLVGEELGDERSGPASLRDALDQFAEDFQFEIPEGYAELDEDGLQEIPRPLGLREFLTTTSSGSLNLNTVRPELLMALMFHTNDFKLAAERALQIDDYLNSYDSDDEGEDGETVDPEPDEEDGEPQDAAFKIFHNHDDLAKVDEEWTEPQGNEDESVVDLLKYDFQRMGFRSEYFIVLLEAERGGRTLKAELVLHRNTDENRIEVLSWRPLHKR